MKPAPPVMKIMTTRKEADADERAAGSPRRHYRSAAIARLNRPEQKREV
jgi:hypothetical protein